MTEQNMPNGLPPQLRKASPISFNGVDSLYSSKPPVTRLQQIPAAQLPPSRAAIPPSQLPPQGANLTRISQNLSHLSVSQTVTPTSSPRVNSQFGTSTPTANEVKNEGFPQNREYSPIPTTSSAFTHSASSCFTNVPLAGSSATGLYLSAPPGTESNQSNSRIQHEGNNLISNAKSDVPPNNLNSLKNNHVSALPSQEQRVPLQGVESQKSSAEYFQHTSPAITQSRLQSASLEGFKDVPLSRLQLDGQTNFNSVPNLQAPVGSKPPTSQPTFKDISLTTGAETRAQSERQHLLQPAKLPLASFSSAPNLQHQFTQAANVQQHFTQPPPHHASQQNLFNVQSGAPPKFQNFYQPKSTETQPLPRNDNKSTVTNPFLMQQSFPQNVPPQQPFQQQFQRNFPPQVLSCSNQAIPPKPNQPPNPYLQQQRLPPTTSMQTSPDAIQTNHLAYPPKSQAGMPPPLNVPAAGYQSNQPLPLPTNASSQQPKANLHTNRYPTSQQFGVVPPLQQQPVQNQFDYHNQKPNVQQQQQRFNQNSTSVVQGGFNKVWGQENYDLLQCPNILPPEKIESPRINLGEEFLNAANCSPDIFRCTMTKIPETSTLLQKSRLPLGILIHPFKDLDHLPVIQCSTIVRCRACRTYINPFVFFVDVKRWKCNLCYRVNELPEEFQFDPVTKTYGDPSRRPEIKSSTIEYIAPSEYMLRPPQPAVYVFLLDVSRGAIESGYLHSFCNVLLSNLSNLPGDARTQVSFIGYNSALHFYSLAEGLNQPHEMTILDIEDVFLPCPDNLVVNLNERKELIGDLLAQLPTRFINSYDTGSALGAALQAAHKMIARTGGRITVFQSSLPTVGPGALTVREDPNQRAAVEVQSLNPANDFYKRLALECSGQQIAVDLFVLNSQYVDLATISGISRFSGGCIHHFPLFKASHTLQAESLERILKRYLTRKIGFEAVMRIRCTKGLSIHTFHGNFFVRSTDLLSLPNVNPEAGFGMQVSIDESLADLHTVCFQAALLYTSSKGERRIRVHTLCVPIVSTLPEVLAVADQQCIVGLLAKMAVDRSMQSSLSDAREAFINVAIDILSSYKMSLNLGSGPSGLLAPESLKLLPLYISALLKYLAFRTGTSTRLDDRVKAMCDMKTLPLYMLIQSIYPDLYPVHNLEDQNTTLNVDGEAVPQPPRLQLSARSLDSKGAFLLDMGEHMVLLVGPAVSHTFLNEVLGVPDYNSISDQMYDLPNIDTPHNQRLHNFISYLNDDKPFVATLQVIRENSPIRNVFIERLIEDRIETALSYHEFLQHLKTQVK